MSGASLREKGLEVTRDQAVERCQLRSALFVVQRRGLRGSPHSGTSEQRTGNESPSIVIVKTGQELDGGPSSDVWFVAHVNAKQRLPMAPVAYGVAVLPR